MALTAGWYDLVIEQGTDVSLGFALKLDDGTLLDTAGYTARAKVRATYAGPVLLDLSTANGRLTVGIQGTVPNQWNLQLTVDHGTTAALTDWGLGVWDCEIVDPMGNVKRVLEGAAALSREVTY